MDHVAFRMPVLILSIPEDFDELFQDRSLTSIAALSELSGVVIVTIDLSIVLVVAILGAKYRRAHRASEVVNVVFPVKGCDI